MAPPTTDPRVRWFHDRLFCLRQGETPTLSRASGDSGFVAHLSSSTHGATGWDWSFKLSKRGEGWSFAHDGKLTVFLDEPGAFVPADAKVGDMVAVRLPRARETLYPHRFTVHGGQGGPVVGHGFTKLFIPVTFELMVLFSGYGLLVRGGKEAPQNSWCSWGPVAVAGSAGLRCR